MAKKKSKEKDTTEAGDPSPPQSDVFKSLFGAVEEQNPAASALFSDNNPFRRKNLEEAAKLESDTAILKEAKRKKEKVKDKNPNSEDGEVETPLVAKKSKKEKALDGEEGGDESVVKKSKKEKALEPQLGDLEGGEEGKITSSELDGASESPESEKKMKKRKRDELERGYEEKKYGTAPEEEAGLVGKVTGKKRKNVDDAAVEALVPKEGFDDESKLLRTVFVGNLPLKVKKKLLMKEFGKFGEVESVRIRSIPLTDTKIPRKGAIMQKKINENADSVHAYIVFKTEESAEASLAHNMAVVAGNHIRVDRACPPRKKLKVETATLYDNKRTVFVGNLPFDVKDEEVYQLFCSINDSNVEAVRVVRDPNVGIGKGIAYVLFKTREAASMVVRKRSLKLRDRELRLSHAKADATPSKRKSPSGAETAYSPASKRFASDSTPSSANKPNSKPSMSYQGMRSNKSDTNKKVHSAINVAANSTFTTSRPAKERLTKRPSVAARKAKANAKAGGGQQGGVKRKFDSRTPGSSNQKKSKRRFG